MAFPPSFRLFLIVIRLHFSPLLQRIYCLMAHSLPIRSKSTLPLGSSSAFPFLVSSSGNALAELAGPGTMPEDHCRRNNELGGEGVEPTSCVYNAPRARDPRWHVC